MAACGFRARWRVAVPPAAGVCGVCCGSEVKGARPELMANSLVVPAIGVGGTMDVPERSNSRPTIALSVSMPLSCVVTRSQATMKLPVPLMATVGCTFGPPDDALAGSRCWLTWNSSPTFSPA